MFKKFIFYYYSLMNVIDHDFNSRPRCYLCKKIMGHNYINHPDPKIRDLYLLETFCCYTCVLYFTKLGFILNNEIISKKELKKFKKLRAFQ